MITQDLFGPSKKQTVAEAALTTKQPQGEQPWKPSMDKPEGEHDPIHGKAPKKGTVKYDIWKRKVAADKKGVAEASDPSGIIHAAKHLNKSFLIKAAVAEGGTKTYRVKAQSERVAVEKFKQHASMAKILKVKEEGVDEAYPHNAPGDLPLNARPTKRGYWQAALDKIETNKCPQCHSSDTKTYSDGEKTCNHCHTNWNVKGVAEGSSRDDMVGFSVDTERAYQAVMARFGDHIEHNQDSGIMYVPSRLWPSVEQTAHDADGIGAIEDHGNENPEHYGVTEGSSEEIDEVSNELLGRYKKLAGLDATKADKAGDFKRGDKRFSGIVKATNKQFDNDAKKPVGETFHQVSSVDMSKFVVGAKFDHGMLGPVMVVKVLGNNVVVKVKTDGHIVKVTPTSLH